MMATTTTTTTTTSITSKVATTMARTVQEASVPTRVISNHPFETPTTKHDSPNHDSNYHHNDDDGFVGLPLSQQQQSHSTSTTTTHKNNNNNDDDEAMMEGVGKTTVTTTINVDDNNNIINNMQKEFMVTIRLDPHEEELFETLLQVADTWHREQLEGQQQQQHKDTVDDHSAHQPEAAAAAVAVAVVTPPALQLRVAGGWVRDKVLGVSRSSDVDITVDLMSGVEFARLVQQHYHDHHSHPDMTCSSKIGIVAANPDQSKHLETATMRFHFDYTHRYNKQQQQENDIDMSHEPSMDHYNYNQEVILDVDFCQLRSQEVYEANSRIPTVTIGTAWEDAQRRDFTMNALFWNLRTRQVEDWTRRGLMDLLISKTLETPLSPESTLLEDPLRALRAIRFAVRFDMTLDPSLRLATQQHSLHVALERKISRERVGKELEGMISGTNAKPLLALQLLIELDLASSVFCWIAPNFSSSSSTSTTPSPSPPPITGDNTTINTTTNSNTMSRFEGSLLGQAFCVDERTLPTIAPLQRQAWEESRTLLQFIPPLLEAYHHQQQQAQNLHNPTRAAATSSSYTRLDTRMFHLAVFLLPFRDITVDALFKKKRVQRPLVAYFLHESIKFKNKDVQGMTTIMDHLSSMTQLLDDVVAANTTSSTAATTSTDQQQQQLLLQSQQQSQQQNRVHEAPSVASLCRAKAGLVLRASKDLWVTCLWVAIVLKLRSQQQTLPLASIATHTTTTNWLQVGLDVYRMIVIDLQLDQVWKVKPLLDGDAVIRALSLPRGPLVGKYLEEQVMWMLLHPQGSKNECQEHLLSVKRRRMLEKAGSSLSDEEQNRNMTTMTTTTNREPSERHISKKLHGMETEDQQQR